MKLTVKDCLELNAFAGAEVLTHADGLAGNVSSVSVFDGADESDLNLYSSGKSEMLLTGFLGAKNDVAKQCRLVESMARKGCPALAVFFAGRDAEKAYNSMPKLPDGISPLLSGDRWIDVANDSIGKGEAINKIRIKYELEKDECMAFGDYLNDLTMIRECGESYAMANAHPEIKTAARYVTEYDNDHDGVMRVLRNI